MTHKAMRLGRRSTRWPSLRRSRSSGGPWREVCPACEVGELECRSCQGRPLIANRSNWVVYVSRDVSAEFGQSKPIKYPVLHTAIRVRARVG